MAAGCHRQSWAKGRLRCTDRHASLSEPQFPPLTQEEDDRVPEETFGEWTRSGLRAARCPGAGEAAGVGSGGADGEAAGACGRGDHRVSRAPPSDADVTTFPRRLLPPPRRCRRSDRRAGRVTGSAGRGRGREVTAATRGRWLRTSASSRRRRAGPPRLPRRTRRPPFWPSRRARLLASRMTPVSGHLPAARWPLRSRDSRAGVSQRSGLEPGAEASTGGRRPRLGQTRPGSLQ